MAKGKELSGVLFKNKDRKTEKHPMYKGSCMVNGQEYWLSAWVNEHEEHGKYMSLKFEVKEQKNISGIKRDNNPDADVPF
jgi:hypothetical protein